ncbi:MAG: RAMP superfamily CRISPR-associated protein [Candidatus Bathyarchaeota archaeon]|nr:RAMP superfamily CRISPR-associated protein [Candidatus Bathyarchaeota archaeon]
MSVFCYKIRGVLRAVTPLHIGSGLRTGVIKRCRGYLPGAVLRGAVGTALIKSVCKLDRPLINHEDCEHFEDCLYAQLFGEEFGKTSKVFFRYSYPQHLICNGVFEPSPMTLFRCISPQCRRVFDDFIAPDVCKCGASVKPYRGFKCSGCGELDDEPVKIGRLTLTAVDREKVSAAQIRVSDAEAAGTLHTLEVIEFGSRFSFEIVVHRDLGGALSILRNVLERALPDEGIGGSKSRGLGKVVVEDLRVEHVDTSSLESWADEFAADRFRVRLLSPLLLDGGSLDGASLLEAARRAYSWAFSEGKPKLPDVNLRRWVVRGELFSGWSLKFNRMRRVEPAVSAGSVYEFECDVKSRELALSLAALEHYAIGAYKPHGCGQIRIGKG